MRTEVASMLVMKKINFFMLISFLFFQCYFANAMHNKILTGSAFIGGGAAAIFLGANCCKHSDVAEPKEEDKQGQDEEQHFKKDEPIKIDEQPIRRIVRTESNGSDKSSNESVSSTKAVVHTDDFTENKSYRDRNEKISDESRRNDSAENKKFFCFKLCQKKDHCHHNLENTVDFINESLEDDTSTPVEPHPDARSLAREQSRNGSQAKESDQHRGTEDNNTREGNNSHQLAETLCNAVGCVNTALRTTRHYAVAGANCVGNSLVSAAKNVCDRIDINN
jgi:hypothetical protein